MTAALFSPPALSPSPSKHSGSSHDARNHIETSGFQPRGDLESAEKGGLTLTDVNVSVDGSRYAGGNGRGGRVRDVATRSVDGVTSHAMRPLSQTFDLRAVAGGEAARFMRAVVEDLVQAL